MEEEHETSSLRARRKKSSVTLACCFNGHDRAASLDASSFPSPVPPSPSTSRRISPTAWIRSKTNDLPDVKIRGRYRGLMSCMRRHRRHSSADFSYDPLSYSLNFEDDDHDSSDVTGEFPMRSFAARLPLSPPRSAAAAGDGDQIRMEQQPQMMIRTTPQPPISRSPSTTRAAAVAEVRKSLQQLDVEAPAGWTRGSPELPTPVNNLIRKQQHAGVEIRKSRSPERVGELMRRSLDFPHPPATPKKVSLTSTTNSTSTTTPTSRPVLVELF